MGIDDDADLDLQPMEPPAPKARQARLPIDAPRPKFGQPIDAPRARKRSTAGVASTPADEDKVGDYRHADASRTNIPEAGLATQDRTPTDRGSRRSTTGASSAAGATSRSTARTT